MTRSKTYLTEAEIQELSALSEEELGKWLLARTPAQLVSVLIRLLRSYRIAATVANSAWRFLDENAKGQPTASSFLELQRALHGYSPANYPLLGADRELLCRNLEEVYNRLSEAAPGGDVLEALFERITELQKGV